LPQKKSGDIQNLHRAIFDYMKRKATSFEGGLSEQLKSYQRSQKYFSHRKFKRCTNEQLFKAIDRSRIIYLGDFHTFDQSSRNLERLIRHIIKKGGAKRVSLGIEFVKDQDQIHIDHFLSGAITEFEFLDAIDYHQSWRFPWIHYKRFFDLARKHHFPIVALNSAGALNKRDNYAAKMIADHLKSDDFSKMLVLFGELHILRNKLPAKVEKALGQKKVKAKQTIIHQNLDEVFWRSKQKDSPIVQFSSDEFSLQTSPPWIKYESAIYWYENLMDDPEFDVHDYMLETGIKTFTSSAPDNFSYLCQTIAQALQIKIPVGEIDDFNLYDHKNLDLVISKVNRLKSPELRRFYQELATRGRVFKLINSSDYYCSNYSINRISFLAGMHLQKIVLSAQQSDYEKVLIKGDSFERFSFFTFQCLFAFLASKVINPYRKCNQYRDLVREAKSPHGDKEKKRAMQLAAEAIETLAADGEQLPLLLKRKSQIQLFMAARFLGYYLAELLFKRIEEIGIQKIQPLMGHVLSSGDRSLSLITFCSEILDGEDFRLHHKRLF
jgi:hypothetical protein